MSIYIEPVNILHWNMFDNVKGPGHIEHLLATKSMVIGDIVLLHVGQQDRKYKSGVYAYGTVICEPYVLDGCPKEHCNHRLTVDVRINRIKYETPIITHKQCTNFTKQFRSVHIIEEIFDSDITELLSKG